MAGVSRKNTIEGKNFDEWHLLMMQENDQNKRIEYAKICADLNQRDWENGLEEILKKDKNKTNAVERHDLTGTQQKSERIPPPSFDKFDEAAMHLVLGEWDRAEECFDKFLELNIDKFNGEIARLEEKRKRKLQLVKSYETALRYEDAAKLYEEIDMWEDAGRVRKLAQQAKSPPTQILGENIHIGDHKMVYSNYIDDHSVRDSVIQRSTIDGISQKEISICPYCGEKLNFPETPRFYPYCEKQILI